MAAAAILDCQNVEILGVGKVKRVKMRHFAEFHGDRSNYCWNMAIFGFFKMAAAAILDFFVFEILRVGMVDTFQLRRRAEFHGNQSSRCWDMAIFRL